MKKGYKVKWSGFILLESHLGLFVFSLISFQVIPLVIFFHHQSMAREYRLEAYRFGLELVSAKKYSTNSEKESGGERYFGENTPTKVKVKDRDGKVLVDIYEK